MKKLLFLASVALMAFASIALVSCKNDDDDATVEEKDSYSYEAIVTDDYLAFFDITLTATCGTTTETIPLSTATSFSGSGLKASAKTTGTKTYSVTKGTKVTVAATVKLKSNWKDVQSSYGENSVVFGSNLNVTSTTGKYSSEIYAKSCAASDLTETSLTDYASLLADKLDM